MDSNHELDKISDAPQLIDSKKSLKSPKASKSRCRYKIGRKFLEATTTSDHVTKDSQGVTRFFPAASFHATDKTNAKSTRNAKPSEIIAIYSLAFLRGRGMCPSPARQ